MALGLNAEASCTWSKPRLSSSNLIHHAMRIVNTTVASAIFAAATTCSAQTWSGDFATGLQDWPKLASHWGKENIAFLKDGDTGPTFMRVAIHMGGIDPATMRRQGLPVSGTGFLAPVIPSGADTATLSYQVRFPVDFPFVRGGKLPGLYGGKGNGGGRIPDGTDGFSFRLMWIQNGLGRVYAYLPTSVTYGTPIIEGKFQFRAGQWHQVVQEVTLNKPGVPDGVVRLWLDGRPVGEQGDLLIRTVGQLKINGIFFDFFFGGNDPTWAAPKSTYADFANFKVRWH